MTVVSLFPLQHWVLRILASTHLLFMYIAVVTWLPGLPALLHPPIAHGIMTALGTWDPNIVKSMLPVLLALVLVSPIFLLVTLAVAHNM